MRKIGNRWAMGFALLGLCTCLGNLALAAGFSVSGERLTRTMRNMAFEAMVSQAHPRCVAIGALPPSYVETQLSPSAPAALF